MTTETTLWNGEGDLLITGARDMAFSLSFAEEFFVGDGEVDMYDTPPSERPTSVLQAIISMDRDDQVKMTQDVFGLDEVQAEDYIQTESWAFDVLDKVRETNTCGDMSSPVDVWIDTDGFWTLDIYDE